MSLRVVLFGTCDMGKPRSRIMVAAAREVGIEVVPCRVALWEGIEDKSRLKGWRRKLMLVLRASVAWPVLMVRYLAIGRHDAVWVGYPGPWDVLAVWPLARLRRRPIVWDLFISLYDTVVRDRALVSPGSLRARFLSVSERWAARAADRVVLDTATHGRVLAELLSIPEHKLANVFVGAEQRWFFPLPRKVPEEPIRVLFYGQCIPLHGMRTIVEAAATLGPEFAFHLIGDGQEGASIRRHIAERQIAIWRWDDWVPYERLREAMAEADLVLGIFGTSAKAASVIPNKVFQAILCDKPIITRDSPAIRELVGETREGIVLVPAGDPGALAAALVQFRDRRHILPSPLHDDLRARCAHLGEAWRSLFEQVVTSASRADASRER